MSMKRTVFAAISLLAVGAVAQSSNSTWTPPSEISDECSSFLTGLNTDSGLQTCLESVLKATQAFNDAAPADQVQNSFDQLCKSDTSTTTCDDVSIRGQLADFSRNCAEELTSDATTGAIYDMLYALYPTTEALCSIDQNTGKYCPQEAFANNTLHQPVAVPNQGDQATLSADLGTIGATNALFLFVQPDSPAFMLCTPCLQSVLAAFVKFESQVPYALGLGQSPMLGNQAAIWSALKSTCGSTFQTDLVVNAQATVGNQTMTGDDTTSAAALQSPVRAGLAVVAAVFAGLLAFF